MSRCFLLIHSKFDVRVEAWRELTLEAARKECLKLCLTTEDEAPRKGDCLVLLMNLLMEFGFTSDTFQFGLDGETKYPEQMLRRNETADNEDVGVENDVAVGGNDKEGDEDDEAGDKNDKGVPKRNVNVIKTVTGPEDDIVIKTETGDSENDVPSQFQLERRLILDEQIKNVDTCSTILLLYSEYIVTKLIIN